MVSISNQYICAAKIALYAALTIDVIINEGIRL